MAGIPQLRLNIARRPIANKYCEGKLKSTLRRELKDVKSLGVKGLMFRSIDATPFRLCVKSGRVQCDPLAAFGSTRDSGCVVASAHMVSLGHEPKVVATNGDAARLVLHVATSVKALTRVVEGTLRP